MNIFNSKPLNVGSLLKQTTTDYAKAVGLAQKGDPHGATKVLNKALSRAGDSKHVKIENASMHSSSGMGGCSDFAANSQIGIGHMHNPLAVIYESELLYHTDWQAQKIIDIPVNDMLKKAYFFEGITDEESKELLIYQEKLDVYSALRRALKMERLYGGAVIFMGLRSEIDDPSIPVDYESIAPGDLLFLNVLSRVDISSTTMQTDATLPFYGKPNFYHIDGHKVHRSRLIIFDGQPLKYLKRSIYGASHYHYNDHFGPPILGRLMDDLKRATGTRQAAMHLIERASVVMFAGDIQSASAFKDANSDIDMLQNMVNSMSNYRAAIINSAPGSEASVSTLAANFGAVPELMMSMLQVLSAGAEIPAAIYLSQAPGGLNATGESDMINYRDMLEAKREHHVKPALHHLMRVMAPSAGIKTHPDDIEIKFPPLETANDKELADIRQIDTQNVVSMVASNVISYEEGIEELVQKDVLSTAPEDFPDPEPPILDNDDQQTPGNDDAIDKTKGKAGDDSRITK